MKYISLLVLLVAASVAGCDQSNSSATSPPAKKSQNESTQLEDPWPFDDPENLAVITLDRVMDGTSPILYVTHDQDDGGWQFLDGGEVNEENAMVVSLCEVASHDPTIKELWDLPHGWFAERDDFGKPWQRGPRLEPLVRIFLPSKRKDSDAYFWDSLRELPAWKNLKYKWIATSIYGDQVIVTNNSPIHQGTAVYVHGPDISGPKTDNPNWLENIIYLGPSIDNWIARIEKYGDEYSVEPGSIDRRLKDPTEYRKIYRKLNPGLQW